MLVAEDPLIRITRWLFAVAFLFIVVGCTYPVLAAPAHNSRPQTTAASTGSVSAVKPPRYQEAAITVVVATPTPTPTPEPTAEPTPVPTVIVVRAPDYTGSHEDWMAAAGIPQSEWGYVDYIITRESGWRPDAVNSSSGSCGLGQQLPCGKWPHAWNDPVGGLIDANTYALQRYGSWANAVAWWASHHWW